MSVLVTINWHDDGGFYGSINKRIEDEDDPTITPVLEAMQLALLGMGYQFVERVIVDKGRIAAFGDAYHFHDSNGDVWSEGGENS